MLVHNIHHLVSKVLELPLSVAQRTHISGFQPPGDAVEMIFAVASSPRNSTILISLVGLTHDAQVLDVVLADGAGVPEHPWFVWFQARLWIYAFHLPLSVILK